MEELMTYLSEASQSHSELAQLDPDELRWVN